MSYLAAYIFQANNGSAYPGVWEKAISDPTATLCQVNIRDAIMDMFRENRRDILIAMRSVLYSAAVESGYCNWDFLEERIFKTSTAFGMRQGTPFKPLVDGL